MTTRKVTGTIHRSCERRRILNPLETADRTCRPHRRHTVHDYLRHHVLEVGAEIGLFDSAKTSSSHFH
jgi:hypothetical protein